ncbi:hypothetical protein GCM10022198_14870 [Klugiella xanthotipulae]
MSLTGEKSLRALALRSGVEPSKLYKQLKSEVKVESVVSVCRAYNLTMLPVFVAAGFITEGEAQTMAVEAALQNATDRQLAEETLRRAVAGSEQPAGVEASWEPERPNVTPIGQTEDLHTTSVDWGKMAADKKTDRKSPDENLRTP